MPSNSRIELVERLCGFVKGTFPTAASVELTEDSSLLDSGIVDSMGVLEILGFLAEEFAVQAEDIELSAENFASIGAIANVVQNLLDARPE